MSKIKKLLRSPKYFWRDSKFRPINILGKLVKLLGRHISLRKIDANRNHNRNLLIKTSYDKFNFDNFVSNLDNTGLKIFSIKSIFSNKINALCIAENNKRNSIRQIANYCFDNEIFIEYKHGKIVKKPSSFLEFFLDCNSVSKIDICLTSLRHFEGENTFWFRLEFWTEEHDFITSPHPNYFSVRLYKQDAYKTKLFHGNKIQDLSKIIPFKQPNDYNFEIDLVFTWVNHFDEDWLKLYRKYLPPGNSDSTSESRFSNKGELKYALRSWEEYGNFYRTIFVVSNCKPPSWLDLSNTKIKWVDHTEILSKKFLPTFNSHSIESALHKIKGLSNFFIYSNDDFFLTKSVSKTNFYTPNGIVKLKLEEFGNVSGTKSKIKPDYLNAAINSQKLLEGSFKKSPTQLHTHTPQPLRVDILNEIEKTYPDNFNETAKNKFRSINDIAVTGFLFHHFAFLTGRAITSQAKIELIQQNHDYIKKFNFVKINKNKTEGPTYICINDGADSHLNEKWNKVSTSFLEDYFPKKSSFEI